MAEEYLFVPTGEGKDLRVDYPELADVEEFASLNARDLQFVWLWANKTSPHFGIKNRMEKVRQCIQDAYGERLSVKDRNAYYSLNFPQKIRVAVERMEKYNPNIRSRAKTVMEAIFDNFESIASVAVTEVAQMEVKDKEDYVALSQKIIDKMPTLVNQIEEGYGIKKRRGGKKVDGGRRIMDTLYEED